MEKPPRLRRFSISLGVWIRRVLVATGLLTLLTLGWLLSGLPLGFDGWLNVTAAPTPADAIVCIGGGTTSNDLPTADGYQARTRPPEGTRTGVSALPTFRRDNKHYDDPLFTLGHRSALLFSALREWAAIAMYRVQGKL